MLLFSYQPPSLHIPFPINLGEIRRDYEKYPFMIDCPEFEEFAKVCENIFSREELIARVRTLG